MGTTLKNRQTARTASGCAQIRRSDGFTVETRKAFAEADADFAEYVRTGRHILPTYTNLESLFASWK